MSVTPPIDWATLRDKAQAAAQRAHAPYSGLKVGAAGLTDDETYATGCNVENASYGVTLCAECGLVSDLYRSGGSHLRAISVLDDTGRILSPCGRCRQVLYEVGGGGLLVDFPDAPMRLEALLPNAFGAQHLPAREST